MNGQLTQLLTLLHEHEINYWLDSGTLLGRMRQQALIPEDEDLDIGLWEKDVQQLEAIFPQLEKAGYDIHATTFRGQVFNYVCKPKGREKRRPIDITIYFPAEEYAYSPVFYFKFHAQSKKTPAGDGQKKQMTAPFLSFLRRCIRSCWKGTLARCLKKLDIDSFLWRPFLHQAVWWIPQKYFTNLLLDETWNACIPKYWDEYLTYRYGDWRRPNSDWVFYRDDQGIVQTQVEEICPGFGSGHRDVSFYGGEHLMETEKQ